MSSIRPGFVIVDKPKGWTSHDVVAKVRSVAHTKVGHAGTLDPMATGLLVLGLSKATRLLRFVQGQDKEYEARAVLGVATDSLDADGAVLGREPMPVAEEEVRVAMQRFVGDIHQVPPMVSARRVEGRRLYEIARAGGEVDREARQVHIRELELIELSPCDYPEITFRVVCSTGTYVRTLADDIARSLGGRAHLVELRRTRIGDVSVDEARTIDDLLACPLDEQVIAPQLLLGDARVMVVDEIAARAVGNGAVMAASVSGPEPAVGLIAVTDEQGALLAVYRSDGRKMKPEVVLA